MLLLIDNYDSFTYNLYQALEVLGCSVRVAKNDQISCDEICSISPSHIVLSPGPGNPDEAGASLEVVRQFSGQIPILGVCLGHQVIVQAFGGKIIRTDAIFHGKASEIRHDGSGLFEGVENPFLATRYHSLVVDLERLPSVFTVTARTQEGVVMGVAHREWPVYGVQFHPESVLTTEGPKILGNFLATKYRGER